MGGKCFSVLFGRCAFHELQFGLRPFGLTRKVSPQKPKEKRENQKRLSAVFRPFQS